MTHQDTISNVIDDNGEAITFTPTTAQTYSEDTGWSDTAGTPIVTTYIPYNYLTGTYNLQEFARVRSGESEAIIKGTISLNTGDKATVGSDTYTITEVEDLRLAGVSLAKIIRMTQDLS